MSVSFQSSFPDKKTENLFVSGEKDKFRRNIIKNSKISNLERLNIEFYNRDVKRSIHLEEDMFTNYLPRKLDQDLSDKLKELLQDPNYIKHSQIKLVDPVTEKVHKCVQQYFMDFEFSPDEEEQNLWKANIKGRDGKEQSILRAFLYLSDLSIDDKKRTSYEMKLVLIDPYHLVLPSKHELDGKKRSKEEMEERNYKQNRLNRICMSSLQ